MKNLFVFACSLIIFASCDNSHRTVSPLPVPYQALNGGWAVVEMAGLKSPFDSLFPRRPYIVFKVTERTVSGNTSCNSFSGPFSLTNDNGISFKKPLALTKMACAQGMDGENAFLAMLTNASHFSISGDTLHIHAHDVPGMTLIRIKDEEVAP
jgi:heat shock protein HslJ